MKVLAGSREKIRRLERAARARLESFELDDGSHYYYDPTSPELFDHWVECLRAGSAHNWPEPPEVVRRVCEAKDVERAAKQLIGDGWNCLVYDLDVLISERRLEPRGLVSVRDPDSGEWHVRDPYKERDVPGLSE